jgi:glycosyltransferase involved in cell wall biosynthesis/tetratricopeptide (TPR) repeat protein
LEHAAGGDAPHQLAREISVNRLRPDTKEWVQAHNLAANYHMRRFEARQLSGASTLPASYTELRHHLYEAGRIDEIHGASERLTKYALAQIGLDTPVPTRKEELEERIALLSAIPDDQRPKVLEYHLALCLKRRDDAGDKEKALRHSRKATGPRMAYAVWLLRLNLEHSLHGVDSALSVLNNALRHVPAEENAFALYQRGSEMLASANRLDDAVKLLEEGIALVPASQSTSLYQAELELLCKAGDYCAKAEEVVARGLAVIPTSSGRHKIAETGIRVLRCCGGREAVNRLLNLGPPSQLDAPQRVLANYSLACISGDWQKAFEVVRKGREDLPRYGAIRFSQAEAHVALGQTKEAYALLSHYEAGLRQERDNPPVWLKAFVCLIAGHPDEAMSLAAKFAPNDFRKGVALDEAEMLRLWSAAKGGAIGSLANSFPGIDEYRRNSDAGTRSTEVSLATDHFTGSCVVAVATEWDSKHGGISTFNRDLCAALAAAGSSVVCYVPHADPSEVERAKGVRVTLVEAPKMPGTQGVGLLFRRPSLPPGFAPDIIIGHDRITGAASVALARDHYSASKRVLFIHTSPEEIEWHKEPRGDSTGAERAAERKREQIGLANGCDLVVAVGPHLASEFGTDLRGARNAVNAMELTPGLPERAANTSSTFPPAIRCLVLGRVEDYQLKGLDVAAKALGRVVAHWKQGNAPKLVVRGAPIGTEAALRERLGKDSAPTELDIVVRTYSADETEILSDLREASLVLMPSRKEGFGLIGLEAIACGVPTLISAQSGLAETLSRLTPQLADGWVLPVTGDAVTKWAERIEYLLANRAVAFALAGELRDALSVKLDWRRAAEDLLTTLAKTEKR